MARFRIWLTIAFALSVTVGPFILGQDSDGPRKGRPIDPGVEEPSESPTPTPTATAKKAKAKTTPSATPKAKAKAKPSADDDEATPKPKESPSPTPKAQAVKKSSADDDEATPKTKKSPSATPKAKTEKSSEDEEATPKAKESPDTTPKTKAAKKPSADDDETTPAPKLKKSPGETPKPKAKKSESSDDDEASPKPSETPERSASPRVKKSPSPGPKSKSKKSTAKKETTPTKKKKAAKKEEEEKEESALEKKPKAVKAGSPSSSATPNPRPTAPLPRAVVAPTPPPVLAPIEQEPAQVTIEKSGYERPREPEKPRGFFARLFGGGGSRTSGGSYRYLTRSVRAEIERAPVMARRWQFIAVHNSGTRQGNAAAFDYYHKRVRRMQNGLAYHFVVGNGTSSGNGEIEVGNRWRRQINGGHVHSDYLNNIALGICLVGDFNRDQPTRAQLDCTEELIRFLRQRCGKINNRYAIVRPHRELNPPRWATDCPGDAFPYSWFRRFQE